MFTSGGDAGFSWEAHKLVDSLHFLNPVLCFCHDICLLVFPYFSFSLSLFETSSVWHILLCICRLLYYPVWHIIIYDNCTVRRFELISICICKQQITHLEKIMSDSNNPPTLLRRILPSIFWFICFILTPQPVSILWPSADVDVLPYCVLWGSRFNFIFLNTPVALC